MNKVSLDELELNIKDYIIKSVVCIWNMRLRWKYVCHDIKYSRMLMMMKVANSTQFEGANHIALAFCFFFFFNLKISSSQFSY